MMEKSSEVHLSEDEKKVVLGNALEKKAGKAKPGTLPERFEGYYSLDELQAIAKKD